jgi:hypothetical protein
MAAIAVFTQNRLDIAHEVDRRRRHIFRHVITAYWHNEHHAPCTRGDHRSEPTQNGKAMKHGQQDASGVSRN